ncbi:unnamed protein product [Coffea canephora]|uniref:Hexosyltransferase n=1 Tax=Coffea canephora TaxID=49390 RepID=A0A068V0P8_COFCA|nr:unnamed protein product [Coffea canephora]
MIQLIGSFCSLASFNFRQIKAEKFITFGQVIISPLQISSRPRTPLPITVISALYFLIGVARISFFLLAVLHPRPAPIFRYGRIQDTFRAFYSLSSAWRLGGGDSGIGNATGTRGRRKLLGFVGIQTRFSSADRREALRSTWLPSEPEGLFRCFQSVLLSFFLFVCIDIELVQLSCFSNAI